MTDALLLLAMMAGVAAAALSVARSPAFWAGLAKIAFAAALPFILKRMPADKEKEWRNMWARGASKEEINRWDAERLKNRGNK